ncbi:hydantoinase/oxoprolinase family protein [Sulfitobacter porphyrae]|uniref:Hydantoinase/oxoprolinase family protein n=1 Tax=Sulfitobacter porphyrae TaxID=1246864 RepID=A0ABW2B6R1_9RHOB
MAAPFDMELHEAAEAVIDVANANMANAVRLLSISRGHDPRDFALVAFGGAGALHGAAVAKELSIPVVIVPPNPGVTSAMGCLLVDIQHDFSDSFMADASQTAPEDLEAAFARIEKEAVDRLRHEDVAPENTVLQRTVEMMYQGQWRSLAVSAPATITSTEDLVRGFHDEHEREYNFRREDAPVSIFRVGVKATGVVQKAELPSFEVTPHAPDPASQRDVWFKGKSCRTDVYDRATMKAGAEFTGPAIIEQVDSTVVVPPAPPRRSTNI